MPSIRSTSTRPQGVCPKFLRRSTSVLRWRHSVDFSSLTLSLRLLRQSPSRSSPPLPTRPRGNHGGSLSEATGDYHSTDRSTWRALDRALSGQSVLHAEI